MFFAHLPTRLPQIKGRLTVLLLLAPLTLAGCGGGNSLSDGTRSGIRGVASAGPIRPVEMPGVPNTRAVSGAVITAHRYVSAGPGPETARAISDADGRFTLPLAPGTYQIVALPPADTPTLRPPDDGTVIVPADTFVETNLVYDTGIR